MSGYERPVCGKERHREWRAMMGKKKMTSGRAELLTVVVFGLRQIAPAARF